MSLPSAIRRYVSPGLHLHFASTPSRSNAAIRELARQYAGTEPGFTLSTTGMHSTAHLLGLLDLGRRYIACFFGDNYPTPRPNVLYQRLEDAEVDIEHWSLASYVAAFRAGARGEPYAVTTSLTGTDLGRELARRGRFFEVPDPRGGTKPLSLVAALRADVAFVHAAVGDEDGNALFSAPSCEGFHAALGAKRGIVVTVEEVVPRGALRGNPGLLPLPAHRVLAICRARRGAHPQPLHVEPIEHRHLAYGDDTLHYRLWRRMTEEPELFARFCRSVLGAADDEVAYGAFAAACGEEPRLEGGTCDAAVRSSGELCSAHGTRYFTPNEGGSAQPLEVSGAFDSDSGVHRAATARQASNWDSLAPETRATVLAARAIVRRVEVGHFDAILAGIGQAFAAARLAAILLGRGDCAPELLVETGLADFDAQSADPFLLSYRNLLGSKRLTDVEHVLGALVCGRGSRCLGVVGAAQVDQRGRLNSTRIGPRLLVGSGGANDIASSADEVLVVTRAAFGRLPPGVDFVTSPGHHVRTIVTECWELWRERDHVPWHVGQWIAETAGGEGPSRLPDWALGIGVAASSAPPPTDDELDALRWLMDGERACAEAPTAMPRDTRSTP